MSVVFNETNFPDVGFRQYLSNLLSISIGDTITDQMISEVNTIHISYNDYVYSVVGIEYFTALTELWLFFPVDIATESFELSLNAFPLLTRFEIYHKTATVVNLGTSTSLESIRLYRPNQDSFDFRVFPNLQYINIEGGNRTYIARDLINLQAISISASYEAVTTCDLSGCSNLKRIDFYSFKFDTPVLDLSEFENLEIINFDTVLDLKTVILNSDKLNHAMFRLCGDLEYVDFGPCDDSLKQLIYYRNKEYPEYMEYPYELDISQFRNLHQLIIPGTPYREIDIRNIPRLKLIYTLQAGDHIPIYTYKYYTNYPVKDYFSKNVLLAKTYNQGQSPIEGDDGYCKYEFLYNPHANIISDDLIETDAPENAQCVFTYKQSEYDDAVFSCEATGTSEVAYEWQHRNYFTNTASSSIIDWTAIANTQELALKATPLIEYKAFRCKSYLPSSRTKYYVEDRNGDLSHFEYVYHMCHYSDPVHVIFYYPVEIKTEPLDIVSFSGDVARFGVEATNEPTDIIPETQSPYQPERIVPEIRYQWQYLAPNDETYTSIEGATDSTYSVLVTNALDGYKYKCLVNDGTTNLVSRAATLSVTASAEIVTQPTDVTIQEGSTATFAVVATGGNIRYQWQKQTHGEWLNIQGANAASYSVLGAGPLNGSKYRCVVSNQISEAISNEATLTITLNPPSITIQPQDQTMVEGQNTSFFVRVSGSNLSYLWQVSEDGGETWEDTQGNTDSYQILDADMSMSGNEYRCVISNAAGTATSDAATLTVETRIDPPNITTQPVSQTVRFGNTATFAVEATGDDIAYQWQAYRNGSWYNISNATASSYTAAGDEAMSGTRFHCVVSNAAGSVISNYATLTVTPAQEVTTPTITTQPQNTTVQEGATASFRVSASGGALSYQWQVNVSNTWYNVTGATNAALNFKTALEDNGKQYRCVVSNAAGSVISNAASLTVNYEPPGPGPEPTPTPVDPGTETNFMINGVDITRLIKFQGLKWGRNDVDGLNAGRNMAGEMIRDRVATKIRLDVTCKPMVAKDHTMLMKLLMPEFVTVMYNDPVYGYTTKIMYANNNNSEYCIRKPNGTEYWYNVTFPLIEK